MFFKIFIDLGIVCLVLQYSEKYKLKSQQNTTTHLLDVLKYKKQKTNKQTIYWQYQGPAKVWNNRLNFQIILVGIQDGRVKKTRALSIMSVTSLPKHFLEDFSLST